MITKCKQTVWKIDRQSAIEIGDGKTASLYMMSATPEQLRELAECAVEAADALDLIAETKAEAE